jgi:hypothetical protein
MRHPIGGHVARHGAATIAREGPRGSCGIVRLGRSLVLLGCASLGTFKSMQAIFCEGNLLQKRLFLNSPAFRVKMACRSVSLKDSM